MTDGLYWYDHQKQVELVDESVHDQRTSIPTGVVGIDSLLRRGGLLPGSFTLFGGRTGTRKTTTVMNMMVSMAQANIPVGFVGLDEPPWMYTAKLMSLWAHRSQDWLEQHWDDDEGRQLQRDWKAFAKGRVHVFGGRRPLPEHIQAQVEMTAMGDSEPPAIVFIDYLNLMTRDRKYGWSESDRIPRLAEDLAVWSTETGIAVVALHQLSRNDEYGGTNNRNAGHLPVTLTQLKYGGEEPADMVLATYRPSMNPLALVSYPVAKQTLGDRFDEDEYYELKAVAKKYERSTFLQLLKNRPGTHREERGVEMLSPDDSLVMEEKAAEDPQGAVLEEVEERP
jgi:RecA/RadA recombinase